MWQSLGWLRLEPDVENPPVRVWRDWLLLAAAAGTVLLEAFVRDGMAWRPVAILFGGTLALTMLWRRTRPLAMVGVGFGGFLLVDLVSVFTGAEPFNLYAGAFVVVLMYALFRWGTTGQVAIGLLIVLLEWLVSTISDFSGAAEAIGGLAVLLFAAVLGVSIRNLSLVRAHQYDRVRFHEREVLARELHDTIAHHVSAIAIQAQAGQVLAKSPDPRGATEALKVIEAEASRALTEMRDIVGSLRRRNGTPQVLAQYGVADIERLAITAGAHSPRVDVEHSGDLTNLRPAVQASLYRIAQESITNAKRHARHATRIHVVVAVDAETVQMTVSDDGERIAPTLGPSGYGLIGMAERIALLRGTLEAGPQTHRGWVVQARIPRQGDGP